MSKLKDFKLGIEKTIGSAVLSSVIFDRDYRSDSEVAEELLELSKDNYFAHIHSLKELENFLILPGALEKTINERTQENSARSGKTVTFSEDMTDLLLRITDEFKTRVQAQLLKSSKAVNKRIDESTHLEGRLREFDESWTNLEGRLKIVPGKELISNLNQYLQENYVITISNTNIINNITLKEFPSEMRKVLNEIELFRRQSSPL